MQHQIIGDDVQGVVLTLNDGEAVRAEAGAMLYMTDSIEMATSLGAGEKQGLMGNLMAGIQRVASGENLFVTTFTAQNGPGRVAFAGGYPGKILPLDIGQTGPMLCQKDSYLCSDLGVNMELAYTKRFGAGLFGGEGFFLQRLSGSGTAYIHSGGGLIPIDLATGESLRVDTGCIACFTEGVTYDIQMAKGIKNMLLGGEGLFFAHLTGPGRVYLQVLPFSRIAGRILSMGQGGGGDESPGLAGMGGKFLGNILSGE